MDDGLGHPTSAIQHAPAADAVRARVGSVALRPRMLAPPLLLPPTRAAARRRRSMLGVVSCVG